MRFFLDTKEIYSDIRFDKEDPVHLSWGVTTDRTSAIISPVNSREYGFGINGAQFFKALNVHKKMLMRLTPHSHSPVTISFDIEGADNVLKQIGDACHVDLRFEDLVVS